MTRRRACASSGMATLPLDHQSPDVPVGVGGAGTVRALVADPIEAPLGGWRIGDVAAPSAPDPAAARAARLEARLVVYAQYAAVVAEEAAAAVAGDLVRRDALTSERGAAAEHFAELQSSADLDATAAVDFSVALTDALHELRHHDAVDDALGRRLRTLRDAAMTRDAPDHPLVAIAAGGSESPRLDVRF